MPKMKRKLAKTSKDMVNHPPHYNSGEIECIDAIQASMSREGFISYCKGNIIKYLWRFEHKNGLEDLEKAGWYFDKLLEVANDYYEGSK